MNIIYWFITISSEYLLSYKSLIFQHYAFQGHPLHIKREKDVLGIVQEGFGFFCYCLQIHQKSINSILVQNHCLAFQERMGLYTYFSST